MASTFVAYTKFADLERYGDEYFIEKAPFGIPESTKEFLVKFGPYIMIFFLVLGLLSYYSMYQTYNSIFQYGTLLWVAKDSFWTTSMFVSITMSVISMGIQIKALPDLLARKKSGWEYTVYASLISFIPSIINIQLFSLIISLLISMYILFQLKYMYK